MVWLRWNCGNSATALLMLPENAGTVRTGTASAGADMKLNSACKLSKLSKLSSVPGSCAASLEAGSVILDSKCVVSLSLSLSMALRLSLPHPVSIDTLDTLFCIKRRSSYNICNMYSLRLCGPNHWVENGVYVVPVT